MEAKILETVPDRGRSAHSHAPPGDWIQELTGSGWPGLPLGYRQSNGRNEHLDLQIPVSVLVLHQAGPTHAEVRRHPFAWRFLTAPGNFDFYPPGDYEAHFCGSAPTRALLAFIPKRFERHAVEKRQQRYTLTPRFQFQDRRLQQLMLTLQQRISSSAEDEIIAISLAIVDRLYELLDQPNKKETSTRFSPLVQQLISEHLDRHLGTALDVDRVASLTGFKRSQFSKAFRRSFGLSLRDYMLTRRIASAKERLLARQASLTGIAHELGFASHSHFSTVFKSRVGVTPSQFRDGQGL